MTKDHFERVVIPLIAALPDMRLNSAVTSGIAAIARTVATGSLNIDEAIQKLDILLQKECHISLDRHIKSDIAKALR